MLYLDASGNKSIALQTELKFTHFRVHVGSGKISIKLHIVKLVLNF